MARLPILEIYKYRKITGKIVLIKSCNAYLHFHAHFFPLFFLYLYLLHLSWAHTVSIMELEANIQSIIIIFT